MALPNWLPNIPASFSAYDLMQDVARVETPEEATTMFEAIIANLRTDPGCTATTDQERSDQTKSNIGFAATYWFDEPDTTRICKLYGVAAIWPYSIDTTMLTAEQAADAELVAARYGTNDHIAKRTETRDKVAELTGLEPNHDRHP